MAKQARSEATRYVILNAAAVAFDRFGYAGTTLNDVIAQSGLTKGALYFHFSSKEELARAVVDTQHARSTHPITALVESGQPALESVIRLSQHLAYQLLNDTVVRAGIRLTLEQGTFGILPSEPYGSWIESVATLMESAMSQGDVHTQVPADSLARFIVGAFTGVQILSQVMTDRVDLPRRLDDMWAVLLPALTSNRKLAHYRRIAVMPPMEHAPGAGRATTPRSDLTHLLTDTAIER